MAERKRKPKPKPEMEQLAQSLIAAMASQQDGYNASDVLRDNAGGTKAGYGTVNADRTDRFSWLSNLQ